MALPVYNSRTPHMAVKDCLEGVDGRHDCRHAHHWLGLQACLLQDSNPTKGCGSASSLVVHKIYKLAQKAPLACTGSLNAAAWGITQLQESHYAKGRKAREYTSRCVRSRTIGHRTHRDVSSRGLRVSLCLCMKAMISVWLTCRVQWCSTSVVPRTLASTGA